MTRFCPYCGRNMPDDARLCPYCGKTLPTHENITSPQQKKDNTVLIIAIVVIVVILATVAIAATVYVYVSGMIGSGPSFSDMPFAYLSADSSNDNCTFTVYQISKSNVEWSDVSYTLTDITDSEEIDCLSPSNEVLVSYDHHYISNGTSIFITGGINNSDELEKNNEYRFTLIYNPSGGIIGVVTWSQ